MSSLVYYKYLSIGFTLLALLLAGAITLFLRRRIIRPLAAAAQVADRIAKGSCRPRFPMADATKPARCSIR